MISVQNLTKSVDDIYFAVGHNKIFPSNFIASNLFHFSSNISNIRIYPSAAVFFMHDRGYPRMFQLQDFSTHVSISTPVMFLESKRNYFVPIGKLIGIPKSFSVPPYVFRLIYRNPQCKRQASILNLTHTQLTQITFASCISSGYCTP